MARSTPAPTSAGFPNNWSSIWTCRQCTGCPPSADFSPRYEVRAFHCHGRVQRACEQPVCSFAGWARARGGWRRSDAGRPRHVAETPLHSPLGMTPDRALGWRGRVSSGAGSCVADWRGSGRRAVAAGTRCSPRSAAYLHSPRSRVGDVDDGAGGCGRPTCHRIRWTTGGSAMLKVRRLPTISRPPVPASGPRSARLSR